MPTAYCVKVTRSTQHFYKLVSGHGLGPPSRSSVAASHIQVKVYYYSKFLSNKTLVFASLLALETPPPPPPPARRWRTYQHAQLAPFHVGLMPSDNGANVSQMSHPFEARHVPERVGNRAQHRIAGTNQQPPIATTHSTTSDCTTLHAPISIH